MRKLVTLQKIKELFPIEGADFIEIAKFEDMEWQCVVKKGEFKPGDLAVYFEIDSFLPLEPEFEFLKKSSLKKMNGNEGLRLKTIKLKGQISQGLALPVHFLHRFLDKKDDIFGKDLSDFFGVIKYEAPIPACISGNVEGYMPSCIKKTDQKRVQNIWNKIKDSTVEYEVSLKLDGTSMTVFALDQAKYGTKTASGVCGRTLQLKENLNNSLWKVARRDKLIEFVEEIYKTTGRSIAIQGELMGPGIQKNREKLHDHDFFLFDVFDIDKGRRLLPSERDELLQGKIQMAPILDKIIVSEKFKTIEDILKYAEGKSINADIREGVVFKSLTLVHGTQHSFKAISNKFLLKGGD